LYCLLLKMYSLIWKGLKENAGCEGAPQASARKITLQVEVNMLL